MTLDELLVNAWIGTTDQRVEELIRQELAIVQKRPTVLLSQAKVIDQHTGKVVGADLGQAMDDAYAAVRARRRLIAIRKANGMGPDDRLPENYKKPIEG